MVEVKVTDDDDVDVWVPSVIVKEMGNRKSFFVKPLKNLSWNDDGGEAPKPNITVDSSNIRLTPLTVSVERYRLMESVEVILCDNSYTVCLKGGNEPLLFKHDAMRPSEETIAKLVSQNATEVNAAITPQTSLSSGENGENEVPEEHNREDESRKRKRGEVEHNPDLKLLLESSEEGNSSTAGVQAKDTTMVLPFAKKSPFWKILETSEGFQRAPRSPHFGPLVKESKEQLREEHAFGMMVNHSSLLESFKDLEPDVSISELNSLKASFAELKKHGFNVSAPLGRISKLLALKDRQLRTIEERNGFHGQIMALKGDFGEMERKILELERQQVAMKEQRDVAYQKICEMESCARDRGVELDNLESEFKATSSAPW
ncbi:hypothetical protein Bca4012_084524 [Brassica carinata]|uniref:Uncharacterized protein n=1 Tax=Brassica carinata TaxID=52824 RepID=A0A8X7SG11_BRACI|nr:hypothetical protein Bca52824_026206 [Brassica carinata]